MPFLLSLSFFYGRMAHCQRTKLMSSGSRFLRFDFLIQIFTALFDSSIQLSRSFYKVQKTSFKRKNVVLKKVMIGNKQFVFMLNMKMFFLKTKCLQNNVIIGNKLKIILFFYLTFHYFTMQNFNTSGEKRNVSIFGKKCLEKVKYRDCICEIF